MSDFKFSTNLFLEKLELNRLHDFLSKEGFKKNFKLTFSPGLIKREDDLNWLNGRVEQDIDTNSNSTIRIQSILGFNSNGDLIQSNGAIKLQVPSINTWYWLKVSHIHSNEEQGTFSIDREGNLSSENSELLTIFRQQPNFPTKIKFTNSKYNLGEYEIQEVIDNSNARLSNLVTVEEENLKLKIVGTFTPGIVIPEGDKYPFNFDDVLVEFVPETEINTPPLHIEGLEFYIARLRVLNKQLVIQDKRRDLVSLLTEKTSFNRSNPLIGVESVKNTDTNSNNLSNIVELAWGMRTKDWSINSSRNIITLEGGSLGGKYKSVLDFTDGEFDGWRVYVGNNTYSRVFSSIRDGNAISLLVDTLDVDTFSEDGGLTFKKDLQILVVPNVDFVEVEFYHPELGNISQTRLSSVNTDILRQELLVYDYPECTYSIRYRYIYNKGYSQWRLIPSDEKHGYYIETSFDTSGNLKETGVSRRKYKSSSEEVFITLVGYLNNFYYLKERVDVNLEELSKLIFSSNSTVIQLIPKENSMYQLIDSDTFRNNTGLNLFINLSTEEGVVRNGSRFSLIIDRGLRLSDSLNLNIVSNFSETAGSGNILKVITDSDCRYARSNGKDLILEFVSDGETWRCLQNYRESPTNELHIFTGNVSTFFDNSGLGRYGGWVGYAICNGSNGTPNLLPLAVPKVSGILTDYLTIYIMKL